MNNGPIYPVIMFKFVLFFSMIFFDLMEPQFLVSLLYWIVRMNGLWDYKLYLKIYINLLKFHLFQINIFNDEFFLLFLDFLLAFLLPFLLLPLQSFLKSGILEILLFFFIILPIHNLFLYFLDEKFQYLYLLKNKKEVDQQISSIIATYDVNRYN